MGVLEYNQEQISYVYTFVQYVELNIFVLDLLVTEKEKMFVALPNGIYIINPANSIITHPDILWWSDEVLVEYIETG